MQWFMNVCFWMGLVTAVLNLHPLGEAWKGLGGALRLVQTRFGILLPEALPLMMTAALTMAFDDIAIQVAPWATSHSTLFLVAQSAVAGLVLVTLGAAALAAGVWEVGFLPHAVTAALFLPLALVSTVTSGLAITRSGEVYGFVEANWDVIKQFIPAYYPHQKWDKYAADAYTPILQAGISGLIMSLLLWMGAAMHMRCAAIHMRIGPELWAVQKAAEEEARVAVAARHARRRAAGLSPEEEGVEVTFAGIVDALLGCLARAAGKKWIPRSGSSNNSYYNSSDGGYEMRGSLGASPSHRFGGGREAPVSTASSVGMDSPMANGHGGSVNGGGSHQRRGYGSTAGGGYQFSSPGGGTQLLPTSPFGSLAVPADPAASFRAAQFARSQQLSSLGLLDQHRGETATEAAKLLSSGGAHSYHHHFSGGHHGARHGWFGGGVGGGGGDTLGAYFSYLGPPTPEAHLEEQLEPVPLPDFLAALRIEGVGAWVAHRCCFGVFAVFAALALGAMSAGLGVLESRGKCGVLAREPQSVTYVRSFSLYDANHNIIYITNEYPYGSVEVVAPKFDPRHNNFTIEVTSWAPTSDGLLSYAAFNASANITDYSTEGFDDDTAFGYSNVHLVFRPPPGADANCLGLRIRVYSVWFAQYVIVSGNGMVNVTGDLQEVSGGNFASKTLVALNVTTGAGPVVLNNLHVEPASTVDPARFVPNCISVTSDSGDVTATSVFAVNPVIASRSGNIRTSNLASTAPLLGCYSKSDDGTIVPAVCGDIRLSTGGQGLISMSQGLGGNNIYVSTEHGSIVGANTAVVAGHDVRISSVTGDVVMSTFVQAGGNETFISTGGKVSITAGFFNRLFVDVTGLSGVSAIELFMGVGSPGLLVLPNATGQVPYADPLLHVRADVGDVTIDGVGGTTGGNWANALSMDLATGLGNIKVELSGGGFNGNYSVASDRGSSIVEVAGSTAPLTGTLGDVTKSIGTNYVRLYSEGGDLQLSQMPSLL